MIIILFLSQDECHGSSIIKSLQLFHNVITMATRIIEPIDTHFRFTYYSLLSINLLDLLCCNSSAHFVQNPYLIQTGLFGSILSTLCTTTLSGSTSSSNTFRQFALNNPTEWQTMEMTWNSLVWFVVTKNTHYKRTTFHGILSGKLELKLQTILHCTYHESEWWWLHGLILLRVALTKRRMRRLINNHPYEWILSKDWTRCEDSADCEDYNIYCHQHVTSNSSTTG